MDCSKPDGVVRDQPRRQGPGFAVVMRCACGARERIFTSRALVAGWAKRSYECNRCAPRVRHSELSADVADLVEEAA